MGFSRHEYWSGWSAISFSKGSPQPRDRISVSYVFCIGRRVLYHPEHFPKDFLNKIYLITLPPLTSLSLGRKVNEENDGFSKASIGM